MKGIVFVELVSMIEDTIGETETDELIERAELPSGGIYTGVGNYESAELNSLVGAVSDKTDIAPKKLHYLFGLRMADMFQDKYRSVFEGKQNTFELLEAIEDEIHRDVRKLYPDAELPQFSHCRPQPHILELTYRSPLRLSQFCLALLEKTLAYYGEKASISTHDSSDEREEIVTFKIVLEPTGTKGG